MIIETEYKGPTNHSPGRIIARKVTGEKVRVTVPWQHELTVSDNHDHAFRALCDRLYRDGCRLPGICRGSIWARHALDGGGYIYSDGNGVGVLVTR